MSRLKTHWIWAVGARASFSLGRQCHISLPPKRMPRMNKPQSCVEPLKISTGAKREAHRIERGMQGVLEQKAACIIIVAVRASRQDPKEDK